MNFIKTNLTLVILLLCALQTHCQYQIVDQAVLGGTGDDRLYNILPDTEDGFIVTGITTSPDLTIPRISLQDVWIRSLDANFNINWELIIGGFGTDNLTDAIVSNEGAIFTIGTVNDLGADVETWKGFNDAFISKTSSTGSLEWFKTFGTEHFDSFQHIVQSSENTIGAIGSTLYVSDSTGNDGDILLYHFDMDGNVLWNKKFGSSLGDEGNAVTVNNNGNYVITGYVRAADGDISEHLGAKDIWVAEIDLDGNLLWEKVYGGAKSEVPADIIQHSSGDYYVVAETFSEFENYHNSGDLLIIKIDESLEPTYKILGGSSVDIAHKIIELADGNIAIAAETFSVDGDIASPYQSLNAWLVVLDKDLNIIENTIFGGNQFDSFVDIATDNGTLITCGYTDSFDGDLGYKHGNHNAWVTRLSEIKTGTNTVVNSIEQLQFSTQNGRLSIFNQAINSISIYDLNGKLLQQQDDGYSMDISQLLPQMYILVVSTPSAIYNEKFIIVK